MNPLLKILVAPFAAAILLGSAHADYTRLVLTGSSTIAPLALEMGKRFEARNPGVRVDMQTTGSDATGVRSADRTATITVGHKAEGYPTLELFLHDNNLRNSDIRAQRVIGDNGQGIKTVAGNPGAIGNVYVGTAEHDLRRGIQIKLSQGDA